MDKNEEKTVWQVLEVADAMLEAAFAKAKELKMGDEIMQATHIMLALIMTARGIATVLERQGGVPHADTLALIAALIAGGEETNEAIRKIAREAGGNP